MKEQSWLQIAAAMGCTVLDCQKQWKSLRYRYTREKRSLPSGSEGNPSRWPYFKRMSFYDRCLVPRRKSTTTIRQPTTAVTECSCSQSQFKSMDNSQIEMEEDEDEVVAPTSPAPTPTPSTSASETPSARGRKRKGEALEELLTLSRGLVDTCRSYIENKATSKKINHSVSQYVNDVLDRLNEKNALKLRKGLLELAIEAENKEAEEN